MYGRRALSKPLQTRRSGRREFLSRRLMVTSQPRMRPSTSVGSRFMVVEICRDMSRFDEGGISWRGCWCCKLCWIVSEILLQGWGSTGEWNRQGWRAFLRFRYLFNFWKSVSKHFLNHAFESKRGRRFLFRFLHWLYLYCARARPRDSISRLYF